jgi:hypothetical protein
VTPATRAAGISEQNDAGAHQEEEAWCAEVGHEADEEGKCIRVDRERATPVLPGGVLLGDEMAGVVQRHQDHDRAAQGVEG